MVSEDLLEGARVVVGVGMADDYCADEDTRHADALKVLASKGRRID